MTTGRSDDRESSCTLPGTALSVTATLRGGCYHCRHFFVVVEMEPCSFAQTGVQWRDLGSLQPRHPGSSDSLASGARIIGTYHHARLIFIFLAETGRLFVFAFCFF